MANPYVPILTTAGLSAAFNANSDGLQLTITHIAVGDGQYTPDATRTALDNELQRVPISASQPVGDHQIHLSALLDGPGSYFVNEVGIIAQGAGGEVLLAVYSHPTDPMFYKGEQVQVVLNHDLILSGLPPGVVTVANINLDLNLSVLSPLMQVATSLIGVFNREILDMRHRSELQRRLETLEAAPSGGQ